MQYLFLDDFQVKSSHPPTPPSPSSYMQTHVTTKISWWLSIKKLFTNPAFLLLFLFYGGCIGYTTAMSTKIEQILCASGYSHKLSGLAGKTNFVKITVAINAVNNIMMRLVSNNNEWQLFSQEV